MGDGGVYEKNVRKTTKNGVFTHVRNCVMIQDSFRVKQRERGGEGGVCG